MVALVLALIAAQVMGATGPAAAFPSRLPAAVFQDQEGRSLDLASAQGRIAVVVYGGRAGVERHVEWGRRLAGELRARGVYRDDELPAARTVWILAVAQMGGIPIAFRDMLRAVIRPHVEPGHSLWLDWDDVLSSAFGRRDGKSSVVVVDRAGLVRLVVTGPPEGDAFRSVQDLLQRLE
jgi:hypothetical protein